MNKGITLLHYGRGPSGLARFFYHQLRPDHDVYINDSRPTRDTMRPLLEQIAARPHLLFFLSRGTVHALPADPAMRQLIEYAIELGRNIIPVQLYGFRINDHSQYFIGGMIGILRYLPYDFAIEDVPRGLYGLRERLSQSIYSNLRPLSPETEAEARAVQTKWDALPPATHDELQADAIFDEAHFLNDHADYAGAMRLYSQALDFNPNHLGATNNRGNIRQRLGDLLGAVDDYSRCIEIEPNNDSAYYNRGNAYRQLGDYHHAERDYTKAIELRPDHAGAYNNRGFWLRYGQGDYQGAIADFNAAIRIEPNNANLLDSRAQAYFALGNFQDALRDYRRAYELDPNMKIVRAGLGITYLALGYVRDAERHWRILAGNDKHYLDAEWVGEHFGWQRPLIVAARNLISRLERR